MDTAKKISASLIIALSFAALTLLRPLVPPVACTVPIGSVSCSFYLEIAAQLVVLAVFATSSAYLLRSLVSNSLLVGVFASIEGYMLISLGYLADALWLRALFWIVLFGASFLLMHLLFNGLKMRRLYGMIAAVIAILMTVLVLRVAVLPAMLVSEKMRALQYVQTHHYSR